jgi:hypothetical protein
VTDDHRPRSPEYHPDDYPLAHPDVPSAAAPAPLSEGKKNALEQLASMLLSSRTTGTIASSEGGVADEEGEPMPDLSPTLWSKHLGEDA